MVAPQARGGVTPGVETLASLQALCAMLLLGVSLVAMPRAFVRAYGILSESGSVGRVVVLATAGAAVVRWVLAPKALATIFIGYRWTEQCAELYPIPHYGAGAVGFYHALLWVLPYDHLSLIWVNAVIGVLAVPLVAALATRLFEDRTTGAVAAIMVALVPLFVRNDTSDANNVPALFWLMGGLLLLEERTDGGRLEVLLGSVGLLALAGISRPEMPAIVLAASLVVIFSRPGRRRSLGGIGAWAIVLGAVALIVPHLLHVLAMIGELESRDSLPGWSRARLGTLPMLFWKYNAVLDPRLYPAGLLLATPIALWRAAPGRRRAASLMLLLSVFAMAVYFSDIDRANVARVHVPAALFMTIAAAYGVSRLLLITRPHMLAPVAGALIVASAVPGAVTLFAPTNERAEEDAIRQAIARLPRDRDYTLVRTSWDDRQPLGDDDRDFTHEHFPDYLVRPPAGRARVRSVSAWLASPDLERPAYFYWGMRCYARFRFEGVPPPPGANLQPACASMRAHHELEPVYEAVVPNRGDAWIDYYGDAPQLLLGLYRIGPLDEPTAPASAAGSRSSGADRPLSLQGHPDPL